MRIARDNWREDMSDETLYIIVPAYNEQKNIEKFVDDWYPVIEKHNGNGTSRLCIINDGSRDQTYDILTRLAESRPLLHPMTKKNGGHGSTLMVGYRYAVAHGADYIFQTDSDGQTDPKEFEQFWKLRKRYDAILGSRSKREDGRARIFVEKTLILILRIMFGVRMPDANAPYRLMKKELVETYIRKLPMNYNLPNVMLSTYFVYYHEKVCFVEISFRQRQGGTNSINIKNICRIGWKALGDFRKLKADMKKPGEI